MNNTIASASHQAARPVELPRRQYSLATLRGIFAIWGERMRFRWDLEQMAKANPHLIDDIGLTREQVEAEIAKPFWHHTG